MNKILYLNGSPRAEKKSSSYLILQDVANYLKEEGIREEDADIFTLPRNIKTHSIKKEMKMIMSSMDEADIWIIAFPLYVDALPGHLVWWLQEYQNYSLSRKIKKNIRVYGIANCGFPEAIQNKEALRILEIFCRKCGMEWRFGIGIGMGEPYKKMHGIPLGSWMKSEIFASFQALGYDINQEEAAPETNYFVQIKYPRFLYRFQGTLGWIARANKNGVPRRDLYARPLLDD